MSSIDQSKPVKLGGRAEAQSSAANMGIDEALISDLVDKFYTRIRNDDVLGPIFNNRVQDNWEPHLAKMKTFWSSIVLYTGKYSGKPMPIHRNLKEVKKTDFDIWLKLFRETLDELAPSEQVVEHFMHRAEQISGSLKAGMFSDRS